MDVSRHVSDLISAHISFISLDSYCEVRPHEGRFERISKMDETGHLTIILKCNDCIRTALLSVSTSHSGASSASVSSGVRLARADSRGDEV